MSMYFLPALASLLFKLFALVSVARGGKVSIVFLSLIFVFAVHNAIELVGYIQFLSEQTVEFLFRPYYVATIFLLIYMLLHGLTVSGLNNKRVNVSLIAIASGLSALILFSNSIIAGQYSIGYSVTAIEGQYYWLFAIYIPIILLANVVVLLFGYKSAATQLNSIRCVYSLFALAPVMLAFLVSIILKVTGTGINAAGLVPISTALFLVIVLKSESQHKLSDLRRFLPFSLERKTSNNFMHLVDDYINSNNQANSYKNLQHGIEREIIIYTLNKCNNNITQASTMMGLKNRSTLYSMMNRLNIDLQSLKKESNNTVAAKV